MNIKDSTEIALAVSDIYNVCKDFPEEVSFEIHIEPRYKTFKITVTDRRGDWRYLYFEYHKDMSLKLNLQGFKEFLENNGI